MQTIWKYKLAVTDTQKILMPMNSKILSIQVQDKIPCIWAINESVEDTYLHATLRTFKMYGTGYTVEKIEGEYIGTIQLYDAGLVFHIFEVKD